MILRTLQQMAWDAVCIAIFCGIAVRENVAYVVVGFVAIGAGVLLFGLSMIEVILLCIIVTFLVIWARSAEHESRPGG